MAELVYPPVLAAARALFALADVRWDIVGSEHVPREGAGIMASNHVSFLDFLFCGQAARPARRLVRFLVMEQAFRHPLGAPLLRGMRHVSVDRSAGAAAYRRALRGLERGELLGIFPEAAIGRSDELMAFKPGAAGLALATGAPLLPVAVWGGQQLWTVGQPRTLRRRRVRIAVRIGPALRVDPGDSREAVSAELRSRMQALVHDARKSTTDRAEPRGFRPVGW
jgi:1-acyl-sn-glycerol-3-phosphate acyltransferase